VVNKISRAFGTTADTFTVQFIDRVLRQARAFGDLE
jgi:hypothetical protein